MWIGMAVTTEHNTLIAHAIGAPVFFFIVSLIYFNKFNYTTPFQTAIIFFVFIVAIDFFVVSLLILKNFDMFKSILGLWIPVILIFVSTYMTGSYCRRTT